jgi:hypothetical protein
MGRDSNIYGSDSTSFADSISSDALGKPSAASTSGSEPSKGTNDKGENPEVKVIHNTGKAVKSEGN